MRVLVTGGTGVVGASVVTALLQRGHVVRLLSRHAERDARQWPHGVTAFAGDVADAESIRGGADGCDAVLHLVAIVEESPPEATFARVNVDGTRNVVREAARAGVPKLVYVSSLGADTGESPYHRSKLEGERIVRGFGGRWVIVRPGAVYGPADEHVSVLLRMVRALPVVPTVGGGEQPFQPVWHEDLAEALAAAVERDDLAGRTLSIAGPETTCQKDLVRRLRAITGRTVMELPVPELLASWGIRAAEAVGLDAPIAESQLTMLLEGNVVPDGETNALTEVLGVTPTPLDHGLQLLADVQPEQLPQDGVGGLRRKRYRADIRGSRLDADRLFEHVRDHLGELFPAFVDVAAEPGAPSRVEEGETITLGLPMRGNVQVRVAEVRDRRITLLTVTGHPLAGAVCFRVGGAGDANDRGSSDDAGLRFEIQVFDRAANVVDLIAMRAVGDYLQDVTWTTIVKNVVTASGGESDGVDRHAETLEDGEAERVERWLEELAMARKRDEAGV